MTDEYETGFDPEAIFNEGAASGQADLQNELGERLQDELGLSPEETQALFDPAPRRKGRRKGKRCGTAKQHAAMPQIFSSVCGKGRTFDPKRKRHHRTQRASRYDPAPIRQTIRTYVTKARKNPHVRKAKNTAAKLMDKAQPYIPAAIGAGVLYSLYTTHANELKAAGALNKDGTPVNGIVDALMYDINNWSTLSGGMTGAATRIQEHWKEILGGAVGGLVIQEASRGTKYGKVGGIAGKSAMAIGAAYFLKALLDPPVNNPVRQPVKTVFQPAQPQIPAQVFAPTPTPMPIVQSPSATENLYAGV